MKLKITLFVLLSSFMLNASAANFDLSSGLKFGDSFDVSHKTAQKHIDLVGDLYQLEKNKADYDYSYVYVSPEEHKINGTLDIKMFNDEKSCEDFLKSESDRTQKEYNIEPSIINEKAQLFFDRKTNSSGNIILNCDKNNGFDYIVLDQDQIDKNK